MRPDISLELARRISQKVNAAWADNSLLEAVTPVTADLLRYWFTEPYLTERPMNFHEGQRQSILNVIYLHEVLKVKSVREMYDRVAPDLLGEVDLAALAKAKYSFPKYAVKMATGTGKTLVARGLIYRLLKAGLYKRILYLVDRISLADQAAAMFDEDPVEV